ncbi:DedA family protein [bacterium]|nr:DedA family protein [bacterium]
MLEISNWYLNLSLLEISMFLIFLMMLNGFFSAPPSELILGVAGYLVSIGKISLGLALFSGLLGNILGITILYFLAYKWGVKGVRWIFKYNPSLSDKIILVLKRLFDRLGPFIVCSLRCLPMIRSVISIPAGMARMKLNKFLLYSSMGCLAWALLWISMGYFIGEQINTFVGDMKIFTLIITVVALVIFTYFIKKQTKKILREDEENKIRY